MGCSHSSPKKIAIPLNPSKTISPSSSVADILSTEEINARIVSGSGTADLPLNETQGQMHLKYSYVSQRGYYPEALDKENQDSFCVHTNFGGDPSKAIFGVFDGNVTAFTFNPNNYSVENSP
jgi:hypothetical protein